MINKIGLIRQANLRAFITKAPLMQVVPRYGIVFLMINYIFVQTFKREHYKGDSKS